MRVLGRLATVLGVLLVLSCSSGPPPLPNPSTVLRQAGVALSGLKTVSADVKFTAGTVTFEGFTLASASAKIAVPGQSDAVFKVKRGDFLLDVRVIDVDGQTYLRLPFSQFQLLPPDQASGVPDLSHLLDAKTGLPPVVPTGRQARALGSETLANVPCDKVQAVYTAAQIGAVLGAVTPAGDISATFWVGQSDRLPRKVVLSGPLVEAGKQASVEVDLHDFNAPLTISKPI